MKTADVCKLLGKHRSTVIQLANDGYLPCKIIPRPCNNMYIWDEFQIKAWLRGEEKSEEFTIA